MARKSTRTKAAIKAYMAAHGVGHAEAARAVAALHSTTVEAPDPVPRGQNPSVVTFSLDQDQKPLHLASGRPGIGWAASAPRTVTLTSALTAGTAYEIATERLGMEEQTALAVARNNGPEELRAWGGPSLMATVAGSDHTQMHALQKAVEQCRVTVAQDDSPRQWEQTLSDGTIVRLRLFAAGVPGQGPQEADGWTLAVPARQDGAPSLFKPKGRFRGGLADLL